MNIIDLVSCAELLKRPCFNLVEAKPGDSVVGYWGGRRSDIPETFPNVVTHFISRRHILSWDFNLIEKLGFRTRYPFALMAWKSVKGEEGVKAENIKSDALEDVLFEEALPLAARQSMSFPPLQAVCLHGDQRVVEWLREEELERWDYEKINRELQSEFENAYQQRCPMYSDPSVVAQLGGWHSMWADDDFYLPREMNLLCWTFRDAEPWYEIFLTTRGNIVLKERIT